MLHAERISLERGGRAILSDVSCTLAPGRVTALVGPNGAGKSTLLRILAGEFAPGAGEVSFAGRPLRAWPSRTLAQQRAVLPQESALQFPFRVAEVVLLGRAPHVRGTESAHDHRIAAEAMARVRLDGCQDRIFPTLSGGEKQRAHLARALAQIWDRGPDERALLLDEPTASMDLAHQHATLQQARQAAAEGVAVLAVLHDLNLAMRYADDLWVLHGGRLVACGPVVATLTPALIRDVFGVEAQVLACPGLVRPHLVISPVAILAETLHA